MTSRSGTPNRQSKPNSILIPNMAISINIEELLAGHVVESERVEYKQGWDPEDVLHTLCAFANDFNNLGGGYIIIGVEAANGRPILPPVGIDPNRLDALQKDALHLGHRIVPAYIPVMEPCVVDGRHILILVARGGQNRPYKAPESLSKNNQRFRYYIRHGSATVRATGDEEIELINMAAQIPYDDRVNQQALVSDIKVKLIREFLRDVESKLYDTVETLPFDEVCQKMGLVEGPPEWTYPRNVALMFFNEQPDKFFPQTQIDIVEMPNGPGANPIIEKTFRGPISKMLRDALYYLSNNIVKEFVIKNERRPESERFYNYPYPAIKELLVNAVYHRSYQERQPIEVRVLPDQITIASYPGPDRSIRLSDLISGKLVPRRYRNRRIGEFLKELHLTEGRGTGIPTALRVMRQNGSPDPIFDTDEDRSYFTAVLPMHPSALATLQATPKTIQAAPFTVQVEPFTPQATAQVDLFTPQVEPFTPQVEPSTAQVEPSTAQVTAQVEPFTPQATVQAGLSTVQVAVQTATNNTSSLPARYNRQFRQLLEFCISPRDRASMQAQLGLKDARNFRNTYIKPLLNQELLTMTIPEHPNSPQQKYRTTQAGQNFLQETAP